MDGRKLLLLLPVAGMFFSSCVKTGADDCPDTVYTVRVGVRDFNYFNAQDIDPSSVRSETLPLNSYVGNLNYVLKREGSSGRTARVVLSGESRQYDLSFGDLTPGRYVLTVWGNALPDAGQGELHAGGDEGSDLYLGTDTLDYDGTSRTDVLLLQRAKGKLKVLYNNLPVSITRVRQQLGPVYRSVDQNFTYSGTATLVKTAVPVLANSSAPASTIASAPEFAASSVPARVQTSGPMSGRAASAASYVEMFAAPSPAAGNSVLNIQFFTAVDPAEPAYTLPPITQRVLRNGVTLVEVDYSSEDGTFEIWGMVDGKWSIIHDEKLEEN